MQASPAEPPPWHATSGGDGGNTFRDGRNERPTSPPRLERLAADPEEDAVSVLDSILPPLDPQLASSAQGVHRAGGDELIHRGDLGADEVLFEIGVDLGGRDRRGRVALAWPGPNFRLACGEVGDQAARLPHRARDAAQA